MWQVPLSICALALAKKHYISYRNYDPFKNKNLHESAAIQRSAFGRSTAGNDEVATIIISLFLPPPPPVSSVATLSHRRSARVKKTYLAKVA